MLRDAYGIHWFRKDLRVAGNPALEWCRKEFSGRVLGLVWLDPQYLTSRDFSSNQYAFFLETLKALQIELRHLGGDLLCLNAGPMDGFNRLFETLRTSRKPLPKTISYNRDYEPFTLAQDSKAEKLLRTEWGIEIHSQRDHLLIEPHEIVKDQPAPNFYQIYTPYARRWYKGLATSTIHQRIQNQKVGLKYLRSLSHGKPTSEVFCLKWKTLLPELSSLQDCLKIMAEANGRNVTVEIPNAGSVAALKELSKFKKKIDEYASGRDYPAQEGTSRLSIFLRNGSLTSGQIIAELELAECDFSQESSKNKFLKQIIWREFYYSVLYHCPRVEKGPFLQKFSEIQWENRKDLFDAWKEGRTGYPIVDAGMRQLNKTGWMHNRVRMIVASFLTKDLLINWQWGERYFMKVLLDGDLALNNGGWQWAASTGCDPQRYFRIFNPTLQSKKFDVQGDYIRKFVSELQGISGSKIHKPQNPIVDHASRRLKAMLLYSKVPTSGLQPVAPSL